MKKLVKILAAAVLGIGLNAGVVSAQAGTPLACQDVSISNGNGTGSTNTVTCTNDVRYTFTCSNGIVVSVDNIQGATSGGSTGNGNTTVGSVSTDVAANDAVINAALNAACDAACNCRQDTPPAVTPPATTTPSGGQGGGVVAAATTTKVAALPKTGENSAVKNLGIATAGAGMVGIAVQAGVLAYRRRALKN